MTTLEKFYQFAQALPAENLESIEATLASLMESYSDKYQLTPEQMADADARMAEKNPEYASQSEVAAIFGKPFSA